MMDLPTKTTMTDLPTKTTMTDLPITTMTDLPITTMTDLPITTTMIIKKETIANLQRIIKTQNLKIMVKNLNYRSHKLFCL